MKFTLCEHFTHKIQCFGATVASWLLLLLDKTQKNDSKFEKFGLIFTILGAASQPASQLATVAPKHCIL